MPRIIFAKETKEDGTWRADLYQAENRWNVQRFKSTPLGWEPMGEELSYLDRSVAEGNLYRLGFQRVD